MCFSYENGSQFINGSYNQAKIFLLTDVLSRKHCLSSGDNKVFQKNACFALDETKWSHILLRARRHEFVSRQPAKCWSYRTYFKLYSISQSIESNTILEKMEKVIFLFSFLKTTLDCDSSSYIFPLRSCWYWTVFRPYIKYGGVQAATLFFVTGEKAIQHLFSRNTHLEFDYLPLIVFLGKRIPAKFLYKWPS